MTSSSDVRARSGPRPTLLAALAEEHRVRAGAPARDRVVAGHPTPSVEIDGRLVLNLSSNDYLGLASAPSVIEAAERAVRDFGVGVATGRVISGTRRIHRELEEALAEFVGTEAAMLYGSCYDANVGLFQPLLGPDDAIVSDALNHASIIDGIRLSSAHRTIYPHADLLELRAALEGTRDACHVVVVTDGVFSMEGQLAPLPELRELTDDFGATLVVDDSHGTGVVGATGRGTHEHFGEPVQILTGTLGKTLGGGTGGFVAGSTPLIDKLRRSSRSYVFTNPMAPPVAAAALAALELARNGTDLRARLADNVGAMRAGLASSGFEVLPGAHPIIPVMLRGGTRAADLAADLLELGVLVVPLAYPIVAEGEERLRVQVSSNHSPEQIAFALEAFRSATGGTGSP